MCAVKETKSGRESTGRGYPTERGVAPPDQLIALKADLPRVCYGGKWVVSTSEHAVWRTAAVRLRDRLGVARTLQWIDDVNVVKIDRTRSRALLETSSHATAR